MSAHEVLPCQPERTKENYELFLRSDFWIELSARKKKLVKKCERCGSRRNLQSHHKVYPDNWYQTTLEMLEVLCRACHKKEHGLSDDCDGVEVPDDSQIPEHAFEVAKEMVIKLDTWDAVLRARSQQRITRKEFRQLKARFQADSPINLNTHRARNKKQAKRGPKWKYQRWINGKGHSTRWVNRGASSN